MIIFARRNLPKMIDLYLELDLRWGNESEPCLGHLSRMLEWRGVSRYSLADEVRPLLRLTSSCISNLKVEACLKFQLTEILMLVLTHKTYLL